jgi:hypothetical protein
VLWHYGTLWEESTVTSSSHNESETLVSRTIGKTPAGEPTVYVPASDSGSFCSDAMRAGGERKEKSVASRGSERGREDCRGPR